MDWTEADTNPHIYISRLNSELNLADITGVATNVVPTKGEQRFTFTVDSTDDTEGGNWNNVTDPLTVAMGVVAYPTIGQGGANPLVVGDLIYIDTELLRVTGIVGDDVTFERGVRGSIIATHADAVDIFTSFNVFTSPGQYIAQVVGRFSGKTHRTQRFLIEVLDSVPAP